MGIPRHYLSIPGDRPMFPGEAGSAHEGLRAGRAGGQGGARAPGMKTQEVGGEAPRWGLGTWSWAGGRGEGRCCCICLHTLPPAPWQAIVPLNAYDCFQAGSQALMKSIWAAAGWGGSQPCSPSYPTLPGSAVCLAVNGAGSLFLAPRKKGEVGLGLPGDDPPTATGSSCLLETRVNQS